MKLIKRHWQVLGMLTSMGNNPEPWLLAKTAERNEDPPAHRPTRAPAHQKRSSTRPG